MLDALGIGYAIKDKRAELGMTQTQVAEAAGVSKRFLWSLELGQNPGAQFNKITAVLGVLGLTIEIGDTSPRDAEALAKKNDPRTISATEGHPYATDALAILTGASQ